jgi:uncharacterized membrane protein YqgA involved in biofilm formation
MAIILAAVVAFLLGMASSIPQRLVTRLLLTIPAVVGLVVWFIDDRASFAQVVIPVVVASTVGAVLGEVIRRRRRTQQEARAVR